jgi:hypothetical protein
MHRILIKLVRNIWVRPLEQELHSLAHFALGSRLPQGAGELGGVGWHLIGGDGI